MASLLTLGFVERNEGGPYAVKSAASRAVVSAQPEARPLSPAPATSALPRWQRGDVTVVIDASVAALDPAAPAAVRAAFATWSGIGAETPRIRFESSSGQSAPRLDGKNTVLAAPLGDDKWKDELAITFAYSDPANGEIVEADIVLNTRYRFSVLDGNGDEPELSSPAGVASSNSPTSSCLAPSAAGANPATAAGALGVPLAADTAGAGPGAAGAVSVTGSRCSREVYDIPNVVTHEVGHFFGLGENIDQPASTMFLCIDRCERHKRRLSDVDRSALTRLYPPAALKPTG